MIKQRDKQSRFIEHVKLFKKSFKIIIRLCTLFVPYMLL